MLALVAMAIASFSLMAISMVPAPSTRCRGSRHRPPDSHIRPRDSIGVVLASRACASAAARGQTAAGALTRQCLPAVIVVPIVLGMFRLWGEQAGYYDLRSAPRYAR